MGSSPTGRTSERAAAETLRGGPSSYHPTSSRTTGTSARKASPRWLMAFFSSAVSSAQVRDSPSGWRIGS